MDLHHVHIFASNMERTLDWWERHLGARVLFDGDIANARNVLIRAGSGRINIYDQPAKGRGRDSGDHLGVRVDDLRAV